MGRYGNIDKQLSIKHAFGDLEALLRIPTLPHLYGSAPVVGEAKDSSKGLFAKLPQELIDAVISHLTHEDIVCMAVTSSFFYDLLSQHFRAAIGRLSLPSASHHSLGIGENAEAYRSRTCEVTGNLRSRINMMKGLPRDEWKHLIPPSPVSSPRKCVSPVPPLEALRRRLGSSDTELLIRLCSPLGRPGVRAPVIGLQDVDGEEFGPDAALRQGHGIRDFGERVVIVDEAWWDNRPCVGPRTIRPVSRVGSLGVVSASRTTVTSRPGPDI